MFKPSTATTPTTSLPSNHRDRRDRRDRRGCRGRRDRRDRRDPRDRLPFRFFRRRCRRRRGAIPRRAEEVHEIRLAVDLAWLDPKKKWCYVVMHMGMTEEHDLYSMCIIHTIYYNIMDINTYIT